MTMRLATAAWADPATVPETYAFSPGTVWLGRSEQQAPLGYRDDRHVCLVSGNRGGKGTSLIVNNLILWPGSVVVVDPKGENATVTAARRGGGSPHAAGMGQAVRVLDPFNAATVADGLRGRFNPLDAFDATREETVDEAGRVADAIVVMHEDTKDPFWDESARALIKGLLLHILTAPRYEGRRTLVTLRKLILRGDWESIEDIRATDAAYDGSAQGLLFTGMINNPAFEGLVAGLGDSFRNMLFNSPKQFESVLQVANRNTEFIDSPAMTRCLEASDFKLAELKTRPEGLSLYLSLPQRYMNTHYRWLRMMIALTVTEMEKVRGRPATGHPVLMVLDEFAGLKRMEVIENAVAQIAGFGVKLFFVLQTLEQLRDVYKDRWETFLANSGLKVFFNLEDHFSRDYVSKLIGETEVIREVRSENESTSESRSVSRSTARGTSQSTGRSTSTGTSENEGINSSVTSGRNSGTNTSTMTGTNRGVSKTWTKGWSEGTGENWTQGTWFFRRREGRQKITNSENKSQSYSWGKTHSEGTSQSRTEGTSQGTSEGRSDGVSRGTSRSRTDGTSETAGTSLTETEGITQGTSQSRTAGASETIQKRALITPDEIGQVFARIDDRAHFAYPGMALVVISGARPVAVNRVNYYEDFQFLGLFDPHPDHPLIEPKELTVWLPPGGICFAPDRLVVSSWNIKSGQMVAREQPVGDVTGPDGTLEGCILAPCAGMISEVAAGTSPSAKLFSMKYYDSGRIMSNPFPDMQAYLGSLHKSEIFAR